MAALCATPASPGLHHTGAEHRRAARGAWQAPRRAGDLWLAQPAPCPALPRRLTIQAHAAAGAATSPAPASPRGLATYNFNQRRSGTSAEWFQTAVREIVKQVDTQAPFLQTVQLGSGGGAAPKLEMFGVAESVVAVPELWQGIAEHVSQSSPDVVILVQRVSLHAADSPQGAIDAAEAEQQLRQQQQQQQGVAASSSSGSSGSGSRAASGSPPGSPRSPRTPRSPPAEEACRRLVDTGLADAVLLGQVGDCCDGSGHSHGHAGGDSVAEPRQAAQAPSSRQLLPAIVPFGLGSSSVAARRTAVRAAALRPPGAPAPSAGACQHSTCFWGVVVQSRHPSAASANGCYLLKTMKNTSAGTGCTCTHFSLTRVSSGEHLEQQFVQSWLL
ncbi:hypothetical protein ABPG75_006406 [Micractinium tetrahymenae]